MKLDKNRRLCVTAVLLAGSLSGCGAPHRETPSGIPSGAGLNVLLVSIDTLRADHLGSYGYVLKTSPALDALAADGLRFERAYSQAPWTTPSHMSLLTSLYPSSHQVNQSYEDFVAKPRALAEEKLTLAEILEANGYRTLALTGGATMAGKLGFRQGFDEYLEDFYKLGDPVWTRLSAWLDRYGDERFFLFLHTFEVHAPYENTDLASGEMSSEQRAEMGAAMEHAEGDHLVAQLAYLKAQGLLRKEVTEALYDGGIRSADAFFGRFFDELRKRGLYDRTLIVVTSDHGEEFADHYADRIYNWHGRSLYREIMHVPLLVRFPRLPAAGRVVASPVGLIDVAPTILDLLGIAVPDPMQGKSLKPLWLSDVPPRPFIASESILVRDSEQKAIRTRDISFLASYRIRRGHERGGIPGTHASYELFDLRNDPLERHDLSSSRPDLRNRLRRALESHFRGMVSTRPGASIEVDESLEAKLRALGYM